MKLARACSLGAPTLLLPHPQPAIGDEAALAATRALLPSAAAEIDAPAIVEKGEPALLRGAWPIAAAGRWSWSRLKELLAGETLNGVVLNEGYQYLPADENAAMHALLPPHHVTHSLHNLSAETVVDALASAAAIIDDDDARLPPPRKRRAPEITEVGSG